LLTILDSLEGRNEAKSEPTQNHVIYKACLVNLLPIVGPNPQSIIHRISVFSKMRKKCEKTASKITKNNIFLWFENSKKFQKL